jgi:hypothetical protein
MAKKKVSTECVDESVSTECVESPKRKRGRPKKINTECVEEPKLNRLHPKINTECSSTECKVPGETGETEAPKKRRGRPPKKKVYTESPDIDLSNVKKLKVLGYCSSTECTCAITDGDYVEGKKTIVICIRCGTRQRLSQLRESLSKEDRKVSKKAFLNNVTQTNTNQDHEAFHHEVVIPEAFKAFTPTDETDYES